MKLRFQHKGRPIEVEGDFEVIVSERGIIIKPIAVKESKLVVRREAGKRCWTPEEEKELIKLWNKGLMAKEIAAYLGRSVYSIYHRIQTLRERGVKVRSR